MTVPMLGGSGCAHTAGCSHTAGRVPRLQWRLLFVLNRLEGDEVSLYDLEAEEEERFEWWWKANVPELERQAAEAEGSELEAIGEQWISDGKGDSVDDVQVLVR